MDRLKLMRSLVAVVKTGSLVAAARDLNVSRSLLSKHLSQLEDALGIQLFNRNTHHVGLTEVGTEYYHFCEQFLGDLSKAESAFVEGERRPRGTLKILAPVTFGSLFLGAVAADFMKAYPDIDLVVTLWGQPLQSSDIVGHSFDLVIRTAAPNDSSLIVRKIAPVRNVLCASPAYLAAHGNPVAPADLARHTCVYYQLGGESKWRFRGPKGAVSVTPPASILPRTNSLEVMRQMVLRHMGIGFLMDYCIYEDLRRGTLRQLLPRYTSEEMSLKILFPRARFLPLKVRLFVDFFAERFKTPPWTIA